MSKKNNSNIFKDIEVPISVIFGTSKLSLDVLNNVEVGSCLELNENYSMTGVKLFANNIHFANGEIIVREEKFYIRVSELVNDNDE